VELPTNCGAPPTTSPRSACPLHEKDVASSGNECEESVQTVDHTLLSNKTDVPLLRDTTQNSRTAGSANIADPLLSDC